MPGLRVSLAVEADAAQNESWYFADGLQEYLEQAFKDAECIPLTTVMHSASGTGEAVDYALKWVVDGPAPLAESYVNLIPTPQGGTHVNGLRSGLIDALKEFCEFRDLIHEGSSSLVMISGSNVVMSLAPSLPILNLRVRLRNVCRRVRRLYLWRVLQKMLSACG